MLLFLVAPVTVWTIATDRLGLAWLRIDMLGLYGVDGVTDLRANLVWEMRLPRVLAAALVGGASRSSVP